MADGSSFQINTPSFEEGSINLNDDLATGSDRSDANSTVYESSSNARFSSHPSRISTHKRTGSMASLSNFNQRQSLDIESVASNNTFFNFEENGKDEYSPLGQNSIYELTIGSDVARSRRNRTPKTSVTLHGGATTIANIHTPTHKEIPQIQLQRLRNKVSNHTIEEKFINNIAAEYKKYEQSYRALTEDSLKKLSQTAEQALSASSSIENFHPSEKRSLLPLSSSLAQIPEVFLDPDLKLDDPRIFKQVLQDSELRLGEEDTIIKDTALQDKLSHYLDIVEVNLVSEIEKSSDSFFDAIGDIESIQKNAEHCVKNYNAIAEKLAILEQKQAKQAIRILEKMIKKRNVESLEASVHQLEHVTAMTQRANKSFQDNDYFKCLNEIVAVESLISGIPHDSIIDDAVKSIYPNLPVIDLQTLPALIHLQNDLQTLKTDCSKKYIEDFVELLMKDLRNHYTNVPTRDTLNRMYVNKDKTRKYASKPVNLRYRNVEDSVKSSLEEFVKNLIKAGELANAYTVYQNRFINEIKEIIKSNLPTSTATSTATGAATAASATNSAQSSIESTPVPELSKPGQAPNAMSANIKVLTPKEFEEMLCQTYAQLSECLRRLTVHQKLLLDIALTTLPPTAETNIMSLDITKAIHKAIELTQIRIMKVISVRSEQTGDLPVPLYLRLYSITSAYLQECELINPAFSFSGAGNVLSEWFQNHITYFVHRLHVNSFKQMTASCAKETWKVLEEPQALKRAQESINEVSGYAEFVQSNGAKGFSGAEWLNAFDFYEDDTDKNNNNDNDNSNNNNRSPVESTENTENGASPSTLFVGEDNEFIVPNLAVVVANHAKNYLIACKAFPNFVYTIESNLLLYFKDLNSKTSQAVLGAGATRTAGLKHITTKHLALCIRFIEFNIAYLQKLKGAFKEAKPQDEDEMTFAKTISNYKDHETELFAKIITIMQDRTVLGCKKLLSIDWSVPLKHPQQCHGYMEDLVRDTSTVAKVLMKYLPELKYSLVLSQIFDSYKRLLVESYCTKLPAFKDFNEKHNLLRDIDYFRVKLGDLPGYGNSGQVIWENVNSMPTEEDVQMEEKMRQSADLEKKNRENKEKMENKKKNMVQQAETPAATPVATATPLVGRLFQGLGSGRSSFEQSAISTKENLAVSDNNGENQQRASIDSALENPTKSTSPIAEAAKPREKEINADVVITADETVTKPAETLKKDEPDVLFDINQEYSEISSGIEEKEDGESSETKDKDSVAKSENVAVDGKQRPGSVELDEAKKIDAQADDGPSDVANGEPSPVKDENVPENVLEKEDKQASKGAPEIDSSAPRSQESSEESQSFKTAPSEPAESRGLAQQEEDTPQVSQEVGNSKVEADAEADSAHEESSVPGKINSVVDQQPEVSGNAEGNFASNDETSPQKTDTIENNNEAKSTEGAEKEPIDEPVDASKHDQVMKTENDAVDSAAKRGSVEESPEAGKESDRLEREEQTAHQEKPAKENLPISSEAKELNVEESAKQVEDDEEEGEGEEEADLDPNQPPAKSESAPTKSPGLTKNQKKKKNRNKKNKKK